MDWVAAFKDDVCVGARQWDLSECGGGICDVPVMGVDGSNGTNSYMISGETPTFKVYDKSEEEILDMNIYNFHPNFPNNYLLQFLRSINESK